MLQENQSRLLLGGFMKKLSDQKLQDLLPSGCASFFQQPQQLLSLEIDNSFCVEDSKKVHFDSFWFFFKIEAFTIKFIIKMTTPH